MIDTHTHLYTEEFDADREETIARARDAGLTKLFMPNIDDTTVDAMLNLCHAHPDCYPMIGFHPTSVDADWRKRLKTVEAWLDSDETFYGIGEVGMDLYWDKTFMKEQMEALDIQIGWALDHDLPLILHCRDAHKQMMEVLAPYKRSKLSGIFHSFTGSIEEAETMLDFENFMLGINGVVTFKNSKLSETLKSIPLSRVVLETDSPYLAPVPYRGRRNESSYIIKVAEKLASAYSVPKDEICRQTTANALKVFTKAAQSF